MKRLLLLATLLAAPAGLRAQKPDVPAVVIQGLDVYVKAGGDSALKVWLAWWSADDSAKVHELSMFFSILKGSLAVPKGYEVVASVPLGSRVRKTYVVVWFDVKPVYLTFHSYRTPAGDWHVTYLGGNTDVQKLWPPDVLAELTRQGIGGH